MPHVRSQKRKKTPKRVLALPDLEHAKSAVLSSLTSRSGQRTYDHAIREFVAWYCSEPRLAFNRTVVLRYRIYLEQRQYAPATINLRLAAVRRVAYEAADAGLLSPELAAGIRRVQGVRRLGVRLGNWLTAEQGRRLLGHAEPATPRQLRDHAMLAMLIGCGLRRGELLALTLESIQQREEHWVIADLVGKGGHIRTVPMMWVAYARPRDNPNGWDVCTTPGSCHADLAFDLRDAKHITGSVSAQPQPGKTTIRVPK
jgi:integrase